MTSVIPPGNNSNLFTSSKRIKSTPSPSSTASSSTTSSKRRKTGPAPTFARSPVAVPTSHHQHAFALSFTSSVTNSTSSLPRNEAMNFGAMPRKTLSSRIAAGFTGPGKQSGTDYSPSSIAAVGFQPKIPPYHHQQTTPSRTAFGNNNNASIVMIPQVPPAEVGYPGNHVGVRMPTVDANASGAPEAEDVIMGDYVPTNRFGGGCGSRTFGDSISIAPILSAPTQGFPTQYPTCTALQTPVRFPATPVATSSPFSSTPPPVPVQNVSCYPSTSHAFGNRVAPNPRHQQRPRYIVRQTRAGTVSGNSHSRGPRQPNRAFGALAAVMKSKLYENLWKKPKPCVASNAYRYLFGSTSTHRQHRHGSSVGRNIERCRVRTRREGPTRNETPKANFATQRYAPSHARKRPNAAPHPPADQPAKRRRRSQERAERRGIPPYTRTEDIETRPSFDDLRCMSAGELRRVKNFAIVRRNIGEIEWAGESDVTGLDLDAIIWLRQGEIYVYPDAERPVPDVGEELNKRATVKLHGIWKKNKGGVATKQLEAGMRRYCAKVGIKFVSYARETGTWTFVSDRF